MDWPIIVAGTLGGIALFVAAASLICRAMADVEIVGVLFKGWEIMDATSLAAAIERRCKSGCLQALTFLRTESVREALAMAMGGKVIPLLSAADLWYLGARTGNLEIVQKAFDLGFGSVFFEEAVKLTTSQAVKDFIRRLPKKNKSLLGHLKASAPRIAARRRRAPGSAGRSRRQQGSRGCADGVRHRRQARTFRERRAACPLPG